MIRTISFALVAAFAVYMLFFNLNEDVVEQAQADMVINNTVIYTANDDQWTAEAVAVKDDKIVFVGSNMDANAFIGEGTTVHDMTGNAVYPGLTDAHVHIKWIGQRENGLNLQGIDDLSETVAKIRERVEQAVVGEWVVGVGWIEKKWSEGRFLNKHDLDPFSPNNPVVANRAGEHSIVANSVALEIAGITRDTPDPDGGQILKDENGEPTGMLVDNAMGLVRSKIPAPTREQDKRSIQAGFDFMSRMGWAQVQQAGGTYADIDIIKEIHSEGNLKTRIYYAVNMGAEAKTLLERGVDISVDNMVDVKGIKYFADGALGSRGAALLEPYEDAHSQGLQLIDREEALPVLIEALKKGVQIET
ncbi:MAG: amidohydrolase family protein, partial [Emcibacteraceae bacterium]|nr:amidohydrolase family protein [Emcibacteraceae bacterium]